MNERIWEMISAGRRISREGGLRNGKADGFGEGGFGLFDRMGTLKGWDIETSQLLCASKAAIVKANLYFPVG